MNRRSLLLGLAASLAAPAIVRPESLMKLWVPKSTLIMAVDLGVGESVTVREIFYADPVRGIVRVLTAGGRVFTAEGPIDQLPFVTIPADERIIRTELIINDPRASIRIDA